MMRKIAVLSVLVLGACSTQANHLGNPLLWPVTGLSTAVGNANYNRVRGQVEVFVKSNHPALIGDIAAGGGPTLTQAFDLASVPAPVRAPHTLQLQSDLALYRTNLDALVVAIMVVSDV